jgi:hypothetical protein
MTTFQATQAALISGVTVPNSKLAPEITECIQVQVYRVMAKA